MKKIDTKLYKKISQKESFWKTYQDSIIMFLICLFFFIFTLIMICIGHAEFALLLPVALFVIFACYLIIWVIVEKIKTAIRRTKLPLTLKELEMLNIETPSDYSDFVCDYLGGDEPYYQLKIIFSAYLYLYKENPKEKLILLNKYFIINDQESFTLEDCDKVFEKGVSLKYKAEIDTRQKEELIYQVFEDKWLGKTLISNLF